MTGSNRTVAVTTALLLALSVFAPAVAGATTTTVAVDTDPATDVTHESATLNGNLTELDGAANATVYFEYWVEGDRANSTNTSEMVLEANGTFDASASGLENDTTYVYVAHAVTDAAEGVGDQQTFTTLAEAPLGVSTLAATDVTEDSATLVGELTGLGGDDEANVTFEYWVEGDSENSTTTSVENLSEAGTFDASVSGLENDTTYVYVAYAEAGDLGVAGEHVAFTTLTEYEDEEGPFGQRVSAYIHELQRSDDPAERNLGRLVSAWVTENNPGADNRPDFAGPPSDDEDGDVEAAEDEDDRGPPAHAKGGKDKGKNGDKRGPPAHAGPSDDDGDDEDDSDE